MNSLRACRYVQRSYRSLSVRLQSEATEITNDHATSRRYTAASTSTPVTSRLTAPIVGRTCSTLLTPIAGQRRTFTTSSPSFFEPSSTGSCAGDEPIKTYNYGAIKSLATAPTTPTNVVIVDVREPREFAFGHIPSARNLPISTCPDCLHLSSKEFQDTFGWKKPDLSSPTELIFYCRRGMRSKAAVRIARECGYTNVAEYPGSWLDWVQNEVCRN